MEEDAPDAPVGRSRYEPRFAKIAGLLCARGATDADLADAFGMCVAQVRNWQSRYPEFGDAVRKGKSDVFDPLVERALAQRALGYVVDCEEVKVLKDGEIIRYPVRKVYPPDTAACIFWLKNRQSARWRDAWKLEHSGKVELQQMSSDQVLQELRQDMLRLGIMPDQLPAALGVAPGPVMDLDAETDAELDPAS